MGAGGAPGRIALSWLKVSRGSSHQPFETDEPRHLASNTPWPRGKSPLAKTPNLHTWDLHLLLLKAGERVKKDLCAQKLGGGGGGGGGPTGLLVSKQAHRHWSFRCARFPTRMQGAAQCSCTTARRPKTGSERVPQMRRQLALCNMQMQHGLALPASRELRALLKVTSGSGADVCAQPSGKRAWLAELWSATEKLLTAPRFNANHAWAEMSSEADAKPG